MTGPDPFINAEMDRVFGKEDGGKPYHGRLPPPPTRGDKRLPVSDMVTMPSHYGRFHIEPIRFIEENHLSPLQGKVVKYVCRYDAKNGLEDLHKARRCLDMLIERVKGNPDWWRAPSDATATTP